MPHVRSQRTTRSCGTVGAPPSIFLQRRSSSAVLFAIRIAAALLFFQHGAEKLFGFAGARPVAWENVLVQQRGIGGLLETIGPALLATGFLTRFTAFILCGEMAVAYFQSWAPRGFWPITNGGEEAVGVCFLYLWLVTAGPGAWSVDGWIAGRRRAAGHDPAAWKQRLQSWEPYTRAVLRIIVGFILVQHGARKAFGVLSVMAGGRQGVPPRALDGLPAVTGYLDLVAGMLLICGLWPIRNGGGEALLEVAILVWFVVCGAGAWSVDRVRLASRAQQQRAAVPGSFKES